VTTNSLTLPFVKEKAHFKTRRSIEKNKNVVVDNDYAGEDQQQFTGFPAYHSSIWTPPCLYLRPNEEVILPSGI
jgi:hypothetical protein